MKRGRRSENEKALKLERGKKVGKLKRQTGQKIKGVNKVR